MIKLFAEKKDCCGCSACVNICPQRAITMKPDADGFIYPTINNDLCVECGLCKKVCAYQNISVDDNKPLATYAALNRNKSVLAESSSGGIFVALASIILKKSGVVFGCTLNSKWSAEHICINNPSDIKILQGSKYVQSNINTTFAETKKYLKEGRWVLFTGTPCQIAGLKSYLGKEYNNLITADLICHGVPSVVFFKGYIDYLEDKLKSKVMEFIFRDKSMGWGLICKVIYKKNGIIRKKNIPYFMSYYYSYFSRGDIYRENCYNCKYACGSRQGDFTMGDYWGIQQAHPQIDTKNGVSVLLVNSEKGVSLVNELSEYLELTESTFEKAKKKNDQLNRPILESKKREEIFKIWREGGYQAVADDYYKSNKKRIFLCRVRMLIPNSIKKMIKKILNKL